MSVKLREQASFGVGDAQVQDDLALPAAGTDPGPQIIEPCAGQGRDLDAGPRPEGGPRASSVSVAPHHPVDLVVHQERVPVRDAEGFEHAPHRLHLEIAVRVREVHDVEQQIGLHRLFQGGAEGGEEMMGQALDETHGVGEEHRASPVEIHRAGGRIEGGEEAVLDEDLRARERPHQSGLAGVGVSHEGDTEAIAAPLARGRHPRADTAELAPQAADAVPDQAAVDLELRLAGTAHSGPPHAPDGAAAGLAREVRPLPGEARQQVLELRELHLHHRGARAGVPGEYVEHDGAAVEDSQARKPLEVSHLRRRQVVVEDDDARPAPVRALLELVGLALADVVGRADARLRLQHPSGHREHRGLGEVAELVEGVLGLPRRRARQHEAHEQRRLAGGDARMAPRTGEPLLGLVPVAVGSFLQAERAPDSPRECSMRASTGVNSLCASHSGRGWAEGRLSVRL